MRKGVRVEPGSSVDLGDFAPDARLGLDDKEQGEALAAEIGERNAELALMLGADRRRALLLILQGMDASGKDGTVRKCIGPLNPIGVRVAAFKAPTARELAHDFLWRISRELPERGQVGVFNRSQYEDVLIVRVESLVPESVWRPRYDAINAFERNLVDEGTAVLKVFLNISRDEQAERFQERIDDPAKHWKASAEDLAKRERWDDYMEAYREALERTSTEWAPWHVVPADRKWVRNVVVAELIRDALEAMDLRWPALEPELEGVEVR